MDTTGVTKRALTVAEFAESLSLPLSTAYSLIDRGIVHTMRMGAVIRVPVEEIDRLIRVSKRRSRKDEASGGGG